MGSEKAAEECVTHDIKSKLGMQNISEKEVFASDGESAVDVERRLSRVET